MKKKTCNFYAIQTSQGFTSYTDIKKFTRDRSKTKDDYAPSPPKRK